MNLSQPTRVNLVKMLKLAIHLILLINLIKAEDICGISLNSSTTKQEYFPWIAVLFSNINQTNGSDKFLCGSSIISDKYSILAAHCIQEKKSVYKRKCDEIYLLTNVHDLKHIETAERILIENIFVHPDYSAISEPYDADLALLKFKNLLIFNANTIPVCLWHDNVIEQNNGKVISFTNPEPDEPGYDNYEHDPNHNYPRIFNMPIRSECTRTQPRFRLIATERTFCAGGLNSGQCFEIGNSGSSMAVKIDNKYYARGIVSASFIDFAGCDNYTFSLFTDIPKFKEWIEHTILN